MMGTAGRPCARTETVVIAMSQLELGADTLQKALRINLDPRWYGTVAEIGAGQEVARWFFRAGGAAGTIAKSMSAYDMAVSDAVYGKSDRYVSLGRLQAMLDHEFELNVDRLGESRGDNTCFFAFADTVVARSYRGGNECHGWMGVKFQAHPYDEPSQIVMHVRMLDERGRAAAGGARHRRRQPAARGVLRAPRAGPAGREPAGPADHRPHRDRHDRVPRHRVPPRRQPADGAEAGAARAVSGVAMFGPDREVLQPREVLRKQAVLVERGSFRPPTPSTSTCSSARWRSSQQDPAVRASRCSR